MIAYLCINAEVALTLISDWYKIQTYNRDTRRGVLYTPNGIEKKFAIITNAQQLEGMTIHEYRVISTVDPALVRKAESRMR